MTAVEWLKATFEEGAVKAAECHAEDVNEYAWTHTSDAVDDRVSKAEREAEARINAEHETHAKAFADELAALRLKLDAAKDGIRDIGALFDEMPDNGDEPSEIAAFANRVLAAIGVLQAVPAVDALTIAGLKAEIERGQEQLAIVVDHGAKQTERINELTSKLNLPRGDDAEKIERLSAELANMVASAEGSAKLANDQQAEIERQRAMIERLKRATAKAKAIAKPKAKPAKKARKR
jgi:hypothetical protein